MIACVPLFSVLIMLLWRGGAKLSWQLFTELPPTAFEDGGGFGNAIVGTLVMVGIAALISVPFGILAAVFLAEFGPDSKVAAGARFCAKTLTGLPSILAGVFAYAAVVLLTGTYSAPAGGIALALLMLPTVMLTAEEAMKMVPARMKEAAIGMGCTRSQVVWKVVLPTALPSILTGVMLAVARASGETAPLLFTALFSNYWLVQNGHVAVMAADCFPGSIDLQFLRHAIREPDRDSLGCGPGAGAVGVGGQYPRAIALAPTSVRTIPPDKELL